MLGPYYTDTNRQTLKERAKLSSGTQNYKALPYGGLSILVAGPSRVRVGLACVALAARSTAGYFPLTGGLLITCYLWSARRVNEPIASGPHLG